MRKKTAIREIWNKVKNLSLYRAIPLLLVILTTSVTQGFANFAYVANFNGNTVSVIDTTSNTVVGSPINVGSEPAAIAITPNGEFAYVANSGSNTVSVINTSTNTVVGSPIGVGSIPIAIAITPNGEYAYVVNFFSNTVSVIRTSSNTVVGSPINVGSEPDAIAITPNGEFVYVANFGNNNVSVINTTSNTVVGSPITVGIGPDAIAITPTLLSPPEDLTAHQKKNDFGLVYERFNLLRWTASPSSAVAGYFVYRNGIKIAALDASTFKYRDHDRKKGATTLYSVTSFDAAGNESAFANIIIK